MKNDRHAREHWGDIYDAIPKATWATLCWYLANAASEGAGKGAAEHRILVELNALLDNEMLTRDVPNSARRLLQARADKFTEATFAT